MDFAGQFWLSGQLINATKRELMSKLSSKNYSDDEKKTLHKFSLLYRKKAKKEKYNKKLIVTTDNDKIKLQRAFCYTVFNETSS